LTKHLTKSVIFKIKRYTLKHLSIYPFSKSNQKIKSKNRRNEKTKKWKTKKRKTKKWK